MTAPVGAQGSACLRHHAQRLDTARGTGAPLIHRPHPTSSPSEASPWHARSMCHWIQTQLGTSNAGGAGGRQRISDLQTCLERAAASATFSSVQTRQKPNTLVITDLKQELLRVAVAHIRNLRTRTESQTRAADRRHSGSNCCKCEKHRRETQASASSQQGSSTKQVPIQQPNCCFLLVPVPLGGTEILHALYNNHSLMPWKMRRVGTNNFISGASSSA